MMERNRAASSSEALKPFVPMQVGFDDWMSWCSTLADGSDCSVGRYANSLFDERARHLIPTARERFADFITAIPVHPRDHRADRPGPSKRYFACSRRPRDRAWRTQCASARRKCAHWSFPRCCSGRRIRGSRQRGVRDVAKGFAVRLGLGGVIALYEQIKNIFKELCVFSVMALAHHASNPHM